MKFICKGLGGKYPLKEFDIEASERLVQLISSVILDETGMEAQCCLYFEDVRMFGGDTLSEHIVELSRGADLGPLEPCAVHPEARRGRLRSAERGLPWRRGGSASPRGQARAARGSRSPSASPRRPLVPEAPIAGAKPAAILFGGHCQSMLQSKGLATRPKVQSMLRTANAILGYDVRETCMLASSVLRSQVRFYLPSLFVANLVAFEELRRVRPDAVDRIGIVSGPGIGHYSAVCAAGVLSFEDGLKLVKSLADAIHDLSCQVRQLSVFCIGVDRERAGVLCEKAALQEGPGSVLDIASVGFGHLTVAGTEKAALLFKGMANDSASHVMVASLPIASHTSLMMSLHERLEATLPEIVANAKPPMRTIWNSNGPAVFRSGCDPADVVADFIPNMYYPALWDEVLREVHGEGCFEIWEIGERDMERMMKTFNKDLRVPVHHLDI